MKKIINEFKPPDECDGCHLEDFCDKAQKELKIDPGDTYPLKCLFDGTRICVTVETIQTVDDGTENWWCDRVSAEETRAIYGGMMTGGGGGDDD